MSRTSPSVLAFYRPSAVNGVAAAGARASELDSPWAPVLIGEGITEDTCRASPLAGSPNLRHVTWSKHEAIGARILRIVDFIIAADAEVIVPNDLPYAFVAAALLRHRDVRCAAWIHSDHLDGEDLITRCGELADSWSAVTDSAMAHVMRTAAELGLHLAEPSPPLWVCTRLPEHVSFLNTQQRITKVLYAGRIERMVKRTTDLIELFENLCAQGAAVELTIAGTGPAEAAIRERFSGEMARGRINMPGAMPLAKMGALIEAHDAIVLVSESEGMPNIVMEAFVRGRGAFLTSGCGGAARLVEREAKRAGVVVPTGDMRAMAEAIGFAAADRERLASMGRAARSIAAEWFDITTNQYKYNQLIINATRSCHVPADSGELWRRIRRAMSGIDGVQAADLEQLWTWWCRDAAIDASAFLRRLGADVFEPPSVPGPAERRLERIIEEVQAEGASRIALYGAGTHTRRIARVINAHPCIKVIIDDRAGVSEEMPRELFGRVIVPPDEIDACGVDAVIVSSDEYEREMLARAHEFARGRIVRGLYIGSALTLSA